eukprot:CAMPEP_0201277738 /NCGR_PEP_ID=MMETSP0853-20130426/59725_1 /ASSEMBLY_ACC=CAM_ASM_000640 /TAXON_ID=183588 /ORGANISM="Pseudo-nitzschia fraudulenta, Strain WWA7" /LENGTH=541 /DNA_ID=CAMNT_0047585939 /DNA_START=1723 /DNA_END=3348 /DNA_ORIENTATION=+
MKFSLSFLLFLASASLGANAFLPFTTTSSTTPSSSSSSSSTTRLFYDIQRDPQPNDNVWSILSNTEKWISTTLAESQAGNSNPLSRKEVSYVCETSKDPAMILANIFRKVKEARQVGESHAQDQEELVDEHGGTCVVLCCVVLSRVVLFSVVLSSFVPCCARVALESWNPSRHELVFVVLMIGADAACLLSHAEDKHNRATLRQTQVLVIPANEDLNQNFHRWICVCVFGWLVCVRWFLSARAPARNTTNNNTKSVSVNCAHLHPKYGEKTPEQELTELRAEDEEGEVDVNLEAYKKQRLLARRSPYPSVVIEVRSMAPPEYTPPPPTGPVSPRSIDDIDVRGSGTDDDDETPGDASADTRIDADFVNQLEALFSKSSLDSKSSSDGEFYESIGSHIETFSSVTPLMVAQNWIDKNDPLFDVTQCSFTVSDATHVDEAYEFVFTNLGMQTSQFLQRASDGGEAEAASETAREAQKRQYMVLPHFLSSSATSLEKFTAQSGAMIRTLPSIGDKVDLECFHPEHVDETKRCPAPVVILQWKGA